MFVTKPYFEKGGAGDGGSGGGGDDGLKFESVDAAIKALEKDHGLTIRNKEQETEFQNNLKKTVADEKSRELYSTFENEIERTSGVKREDGEKAYDFLSRSFEGVGSREKALATQVDTLTKDIKKLQEDGGTQGQIDELTKQLSTLKGIHKTELEKKDNEIGTMKSAQFQARINGNITDAVSRYRPNFDKEKGEDIINAFVSAKVSEFKSIYKAVESNGVIIWHDQNDQPKLDTKSGNPESAYSLLEEMLKPIIKEQRSQGGAGGDGGGSGGDGGDNGKFVLSPPENINTKTLLIDWMRNTKEMDHTKPDFNKYFKATADAKKITKT